MSLSTIFAFYTLGNLVDKDSIQPRLCSGQSLSLQLVACLSTLNPPKKIGQFAYLILPHHTPKTKWILLLHREGRFGTTDPEMQISVYILAFDSFGDVWYPK